MQHLIFVGACYVDTILSVPHFPGEDDKLRATSMQVRRGGNCPNSIEVMQQLARAGSAGSAGDGLQMHLVSCLPDLASPSAAMIAGSLGAALPSPSLSPSGPPQDPSPLATCIFRAGHANPASCYIIRSAATGSRTIVNHNDLPDMTFDEFKDVVARLRDSTHDGDDEWWHFEGRIPATLLECLCYLRYSPHRVTVSIEVEKPNRSGLRELAALADVVFYSKTWAENEGYTSSQACVKGEVALMSRYASTVGTTSEPRSKILFCTWGGRGASAWHADGLVSVPAPSVPADKIVDAVGAGDTFMAGILYKLSMNKSARGSRMIEEALEFAVALASRKIQLDGFQGLA
ncbi:pfkb family kinase [Ophiostoma piceae UAMH 11346]|uniref:Pfkb family kinase n=1 Tax=Ophiostoma piceae (strain UAMH 11346) TaxID=1262450 RepID=S3BNX5_OPHP1|nr:pfkb family kinase [Ophiostoma piceae UAMH 11346]